jgi:hypothetical protein
MFYITFFVDDKNLGEAFKRLTGIAMNVEHKYVPNVGKSKTNGTKPPTVKVQNATELFSKELHKQGKANFTGAEFRALVEKMNLNPRSYSYFLQNLVRAGVLKKGKREGNNMYYNLTGK